MADYDERIRNAVGRFMDKNRNNEDMEKEAMRELRGKRKKSGPPTERDIQRQVAQYLNRLGVLWCHVPNEGHGKRGRGGAIRGAILRAEGLKSGVPDVLIFTPPKKSPDGEDVHRSGLALELKREKGGRLSESQRTWLNRLNESGWATAVANGFDEAIKVLRSYGYE